MKKLLFVVMLLSGFVFAQNGMTPELLWKLKRVGFQALSPDETFLVFSQTEYELSENKGEKNLFRLNLSDNSISKLTTSKGGEYNVFFWNNKIAYLHKGQLWTINYDGSDAKQISNYEGGLSNVKISPNGDKILFTKEVKLLPTSIELYPDLEKAEFKVIDDLMYRHWDHWTDENFSHPFVADFDNGTISNEKDLMPNEKFDVPQQPFGGSEDLTWSNDGTSVYYVCKKKYGKDYAVSTNSDIYEYKLADGSTTNVTTGMMGYDTHPVISKQGKLSWLSMATDGYESDKNDIIVLENDVKINVTKDWDGTVSSFTWNAKGDKIYFQAVVDATYQIFEISVPKKWMVFDAKKGIKQLTNGIHNLGGPTVYSNGIITSKSTMNQASELVKVNLKDGSISEVTNINKDIYSSIGLSKIEKRMVTTTDNKEMLTWVIYPPNFDSTKTYPALLYCQGGPQSAVSQFYSFRWNFQLMAAQGYIIIAPNRRGLPGFGVDWNKEISKDWGGQPMKDYLSAVDSIKQLPFLDETRIGAIGASYGGYSVYMLAGIHENRFKTFISHCGLFNLTSWYGVTEELFFANYDIGGPYWSNPIPKSYLKFSPHLYSSNWNTPILVIHGGKDFRVPENQGMEAFQLAKLKGLNTKFLYFPNEGHWVLSPQNGIVWHTEFFKWLKETL